MIRVLWFAQLREQAGCGEEAVDAAGSSARAIYRQLAQRHGGLLPEAQVRVAVDGAFASWDGTIADGAEVAFLPPFSGG